MCLFSPSLTESGGGRKSSRAALLALLGDDDLMPDEVCAPVLLGQLCFASLFAPFVATSSS